MNAAASFDDRLNPILVKEVRQALRGRYFRALFWLTLGVATLVGLSVTAQLTYDSGGASAALSSEGGKAFFGVLFACLSAAVHGFVPFSAFLSMSAEWDENTHDLLVLSNLRPRQVVYGKLLSALVQASLYYATFGPFLVFAFLLNGVDLRVIGVLLVGSMASCVGLTLLGIATASLSAAKAPRILLMALFGVGLMMTWGMSLTVAAGLVENPQTLSDPTALEAFGGFVSVVLLAAAFFAAIAVVRLSHEEENRSSGLRALSMALVLVAAAWGAWLMSAHGDWEPVLALQLVAVGPLALAWLFFLTESEPLGRHVSAHVSPRLPLALASAPFLPGGGRGALLMLTHLACSLGGAAAAFSLGLIATNDERATYGAILAFHAYCWVYVAAPAGLASWFVKSLRGRIVVRMLIVLLIPVALLGPPIVALVLGADPGDFLHPLNPIWAAREILDRDTNPWLGMIPLWGVALLAVALNVPRIWSGVSEVVRCSRARALAARARS